MIKRPIYPDDGQVVKGPVFARLLFADRADRSYTDIDVLIAADEIASANEAISALGFVQRKKSFYDRSEVYQEYKWILEDNNSVMIEAHSNLVHYWTLRRNAPFGYAELEQICGGDIEAPVPQFMISVVHGSLGHKFHKLSLVVDILQAARRMSKGDLSRLITSTKALGMGLEVATSLRLAGELFDDNHILSLADRMPDKWVGLSNRLITRETILNAQTGNHWDSKLRRLAFRWIQRGSINRNRECGRRAERTTK